MTLRFLERFWARVDRAPRHGGACWRWHGTHNPARGVRRRWWRANTRRPRVRVRRRGGQTHEYVARVMLAIYDGVPLWKRRRQRQVACHKAWLCTHDWCINPLHLYWGTEADNVRDRYPMRRTR